MINKVTNIVKIFLLNTYAPSLDKHTPPVQMNICT